MLVASSVTVKGIFIKIKLAAFQGFILSIPVMIVEHLTKWYIINQEYATFVFYAIALDHALGSYKHRYIDDDFSLKKNAIGLSVKVGLVILVGYLFEGIPAIIGNDSIIGKYIITVLRLIVFLYPAGGAFVNSSIISGGKFPPKSWIDRVTKFNKNLDIEDLTNKKQKEDDNNETSN